MEISGFSNISNFDLGMEDHSAEDWINDMECSSTHWNPMMSFQGAPPYSTSSWTSYAADQTSLFQFGNSSTCDSHVSSPIHVGFDGSTKTSSAVDRRHSEKKLGGHSLAERKRREKLNQLFIALSALLPGLKKMDKASILDDAIAYMKELGKQVKGLEENAKKKSTSNMKSTVSFTIKKEGGGGGGGGGEKSSDSSSCSSVMEARFNEKELLISIHCDTRKGLLQEIVGEIEKLHLSVVNSSVMSCGDSSLTISLIAEKNEEAKMSMEQLVKNLRGLLKIILSK